MDTGQLPPSETDFTPAQPLPAGMTLYARLITRLAGGDRVSEITFSTAGTAGWAPFAPLPTQPPVTMVGHPAMSSWAPGRLDTFIEGAELVARGLSAQEADAALAAEGETAQRDTRLRRPARAANWSRASITSGARHIWLRLLSVNSIRMPESTSGCNDR